MKKYPKVPRYDHPVVLQREFRRSDIPMYIICDDREDDGGRWFGESAIALEKFDGSHFRFLVYDDRFDSVYDIDGEHGELFVGTKNQFSSAKDLSSFKRMNDLNIKQRVSYLKENLNYDNLYGWHREIGSPLLFHAENMVQHTIEEYEWDNIPDLIGFDAYRLDNSRVDNEVHPYKEKFYGYLDWDEVSSIMDDIGIKTPKVVKKGVEFRDLTDDIVPKSEFGSVLAEGVVIRNDETYRRSKYRRQSFIEMHKTVTGAYDPESDPHEKVIAYKFSANQRIKKELEKMPSTDNYTGEYLDQLAHNIIEDFWTEEYDEIIRDDVNPREVFDYTCERIESYVLDQSVFAGSVDDRIQEVAQKWDPQTDEFKTLDEPVRDYLIRESLSEEVVEKHAETILSDADRELGKWMIPELGDRLFEWLLLSNKNIILELDENVDFRRLKDGIYSDVVVPYINTNQ